MEQQIRSIIEEVFSDVEQVCAEMGEDLDAQSLADSVCDRMHDLSAEYRAMPWADRRALVLGICSQYA